VCGVGVVGYVVGFGVGAVVEEDAAAGDAVLGPVVDAAFVVGGWAGYVAAFGLDGVGWLVLSEWLGEG
jgi:hypothetical protein